MQKAACTMMGAWNISSVAAKKLCVKLFWECFFFFFFFFKAEVYYSKLTEEKMLSRQSIEFKRRTMGHLAHSEKFTMPAPFLPISVLRIGHLQLPLTFRWMSTLPEEPWLKAEFGSAGSLSASPPSHSTRSLLHPPLNHLLKYKLCVLAHPVVHRGHFEYRFCALKIIVPFFFVPFSSGTFTRDAG